MGIRKDELEEILRGHLEKIDELMELIRGTRGAGVGTSVPKESSSSQESQQSTSPSASENLEEKWEAFFSERKNKITSEEQRAAWKVTSGLTPKEAEIVWDKNGWEDLTKEGGISNLNGKKDGYKKVSYTSKHGDKNIAIATDDVDLSKHSKGFLDAIHVYIFDLSKFKTSDLPLDKDKEIEGIIGGMEVPVSRSYKKIKEMVDDRVKELFKEAFEGKTPSKLSSEKIDAWRETGLGGNGTNERKAFNNGWTDPKEIKDGKVANYTTTTDANKNAITTNNIDVLVINKNELKVAHDLLSGIGATKGFKELTAWRKDNEEKIKEIKTKDNQLPEDNLTAAKARKLWDNRWDASEIQENNGDIEVVNPKTNEIVVGYDNIIKLGVVKEVVKDEEVAEDESAPVAIDPVVAEPKISEENVAWRKAMGGVAAGSRKKALDKTGKTQADNIIMDEWFALTEIGGGKIASGKRWKNIEQVAKARRLTFFFKINEVYNEKEGDGLTDDDWKLALEKEKDDGESKPRGKLNSATLNKFLTDNGVELPTDQPNETSDMTEWLKSQGAFDTKDEPAEDYVDEKGKLRKGVNMTWGFGNWKPEPITVKVDGVEQTIQPGDKLDGKQLEAIEEFWDIKNKGGLKLPYSYNKAGWSPDDVFNPNEMTFCEWKEATIKVKKRVPVKDKNNNVVKVKGKGGKPVTKYEDKWEDWTGPVVNDSSLSNEDRKRIFGHETRMPGHVPLVTGGGKTTKLACDLTRGGKELIYVVCPDNGLANSAFKHHLDWLQTWGCVNCKINPRKVKEKIVKKDATGKKTKVEVEVIRYDSHGSYQVEFNKVITSKVTMANKDENGKDIPGTEKERWGISIFDPNYFFGFATRNLFTTKQKQKQGGKEVEVIGVNLLNKGKDSPMKKDDEEEVVPEVTPEMIDEIKKKKLPKEAIIIFDEGHLGNPAYQEIIRDIIVSGYRVIKMSATFKGMDFSITTTFPRENLYMNYIPAKYTKDGQEVDFDNKLANSRTQVFLKDVNEVDVSDLVTKNIPHVIINQTNEAFYESITKGMPDGSLIIVDNSREMGYTPKVEIVVCSGWTQYPTLKPDWTYTVPDPSRISTSSLIQQIGRVARIDYGTAIILSKKLEEPTPKDDVAVFVIRAALLDDEEAKKKAGFASNSTNINVLRACVCLPGDSDKKEGKFGLPPEVLAVGAMGMETSTYVKIKFHRSLKTFSPDPILYDKHKLDWNPPPLDEKEAHEILKLMVQTNIEWSKDFPHQLEVKLRTPLIDELDQGQDPETKGPGKGKFKLEVEEVRQILHTVAKSRLVDTDSELATNPKKLQWPAAEEKTFNGVVAIHKLVLGAGVNIISRDIDPDDSKKGQSLVVEVDYPVTTESKSSFVVYDEKTERLKGKIRHILEEANLNHLDEVKEALEEDTLEGYEILAIELMTFPLCNRLVNEIGTNRANELASQLKKIVKEIDLNESEANIEVKNW